ncbi:C-type Lectin CRL-like isoform X2 [Ostrea edulis]|uniref:C-type Lectin CRL-like isoform X2 n=1 Tax=Ostrea edulis TaxID=37623 RepID=UPI0024AF7B35|nr:C-type Lectin CRL-like isoform X2 [Ostrea edulis]
MAIEQGGIFIEPHLLILRSHPKDRPIESPFTTSKGVVRTSSNPDPHGIISNGHTWAVLTGNNLDLFEFEQALSKRLPDGCWIDGTDALVEGEWVWTTTGKAISTEDYQKWFPGEPNSLGRSGEDCLDLLHHEKYSWNDERCEVMNNFLCETSATDDGINVG